MADTIEDLQRQIDELNQKVRELTDPKQSSILGTRDNPIRLVYLIDPDTGGVAEVSYSRSTSAIRTTEVR